MTRTYEGFPRITVDPEVMTGKPCIRGMRVTVGMILGNLGAGVSIDELLETYPYIERDDVLESIRFGAWLASEKYLSIEPALVTATEHPKGDLAADALVTIENEQNRIRRLSPSESL